MEAAWWEVCSEAWVNILLEMPSLGIGLHGHDVRIRYCGRWPRRGLLVYDIDSLNEALRGVLAGLDRQRLSKVRGGEGALEDLALYVCREVSSRLEPPPARAVVEASVPNGSVRVGCEASVGGPH